MTIDPDIKETAKSFAHKWEQRYGEGKTEDMLVYFVERLLQRERQYTRKASKLEFRAQIGRTLLP